MSIAYKRKKYLFDEIADANSLGDIGIDKSQIIRAIESLKANSTEVNPTSIAFELGVPKAFVYADIELLESIYKNTNELQGADKVIAELIKELKSKNRKVKKLTNQLEELELESKKSYNDGFSKGASMSFTKPVDSNNIEQWARGLLYISDEEVLDINTVKKAYRNMVSLVHPDTTARDTNEELKLLQKAYEYLLERV